MRARISGHGRPILAVPERLDLIDHAETGRADNAGSGPRPALAVPSRSKTVVAYPVPRTGAIPPAPWPGAFTRRRAANVLGPYWGRARKTAAGTTTLEAVPAAANRLSDS